MIAGERFLGAFRTIEAKLRKDAAAGPSMGFAELVRLNRPRNQVVSRCAEDLLEFAELRNAITHRRDDRLLAEPTDEAARGLEGIRDALISPPTLSSAIGIRTVAVCRPESTVREAVVTMKTGDFSQLPVYGARAFVGLLTAETVARWVAAEFEHNDGILEDTTVEEAMKWTEDVDNFAFVARTSTVFEGLALFDAFNNRGKTLDAILVTHDGRPSKAINIVTIYDVPLLLRHVPSGLVSG